MPLKLQAFVEVNGFFEILDFTELESQKETGFGKKCRSKSFLDFY